MTTPDPMSAVIEAFNATLLRIAFVGMPQEPKDKWGRPDWCDLIKTVNDALPLARSMQEKLERYDELVKYKEALEWLFERLSISTYVIEDKDCPAVIKKMLGGKHE